MLNAEKYAENIKSFPDCEFGMTHGNFVRCYHSCQNCDFNTAGICVRTMWMVSECNSEPITIPDDTPTDTVIETSHNGITWVRNRFIMREFDKIWTTPNEGVIGEDARRLVPWEYARPIPEPEPEETEDNND